MEGGLKRGLDTSQRTLRVSNGNKANNDKTTTASSSSSSGIPKVDASFMASMTFASLGGAGAPRGGGDCDECGGLALQFTPQAIIEAVRKHKRQRNEYRPMRRSQQRELVARHGPISVYKLTIPMDSEPMIEYGVSHRLIWIQALPDVSILRTIGKGIVGSQDEERGRQDLLSWRQNRAFLVPSNDGKAVAWIHGNKERTKSKLLGIGADWDDEDEPDRKVEESKNQNATSDENDDTSNITVVGHAILYVCKIPQDCVVPTKTPKDEPGEGNNNNNNKEDVLPKWRRLIQSICCNELETFVNENALKENELKYQQISEESSLQLRKILLSL